MDGNPYALVTVLPAAFSEQMVPNVAWVGEKQ